MKERFSQYVASTVGYSVVQQIVGWLRHALIAAYFGLSRDFDAYLVVYTLVSIFIFNSALVFDTVAVSRFVQIRDKEGDDAFWRASNRLLLQSFTGSILMAICAVAITWILMPIVAAGFSNFERAVVQRISWYFIPWVMVIIPYYALSAHLKAIWKFHWVFGAEIAVIVISAVTLFFEHSDISALPIAYAVGYGAAGLGLFVRRGWKRVSSRSQATAILSGMSGQYAAMQIGNLAGLVDRFFQSFLVPGGISALGYSGLIVNNLSSLLTFREIYVVPLSTELGREDRLVRILQGEAFVAVPCACFLFAYAEPLITVLFQRGHFTSADVAVAAEVLRIQAISLFVSPLLAPLERVFQIVGRLRFTQIRYVATLLATLSFQYLFVFVLGMDVQGVAWAGLCSAVVVLMTVAVLVRQCAMNVQWQKIIANALLAGVIAGGAVGVSLYLASMFNGLLALAAGGTGYGAIIAAAYFVIRRRLRLIIG